MSIQDERIEIAELQKEWRNTVTSSIHQNDEKLDKILDQLSEIRMDYVKNDEFKSLKGQVYELQSDKHKIIGAAVILNAVGIAVLWLVTKLWN